MDFLIVVIPFAAALLLYLPLSARISFAEYNEDGDADEEGEHFTVYAVAVYIAQHIELYAAATSIAAAAVSLFVFKDPAFRDPVRIDFVISLIAVAIATLSALFRRVVDGLVAQLMALQHCIFVVIISCCDDEDDTAAMCAFSAFAIEELFSLRMQLKLLSDFSKALIHNAPFSEICEDDINGLFGSLLSLFSQYLRNIPNACNFSFAQSQPAYQMLLDLNDKI